MNYDRNELNKRSMTMNERVKDNWFPGRWLGGTSLILGPIFMLIGVILRSRFYFFFRDQLEA